MVIDLRGAVVIIDEAHNMEDVVCGFRKAAIPSHKSAMVTAILAEICHQLNEG